MRDLVDGKGWAHAVAHIGDNLAVLAEDSAIGHDDLMDILCAIKDNICISYHNYRSGEDLRLADAVIKVLARGLVSEAEFADWITSFLAFDKTGDALADDRLYSNGSNFLWSMNFRTKDKYPELYPFVRNAIIELMESV